MASGTSLSIFRILSGSTRKPLFQRITASSTFCFTPCRCKVDVFGRTLEKSFQQNPKNMEEIEKLGLKSLMKKNRMYAQYNYQEWRFPTNQRAIDISSTRFIVKDYEEKERLLKRLRSPIEEIQSIRMERMSHRQIKKKVPNFHRRRFPTEAQDIYIKAHDLLNTENWTMMKKKDTEEALHGLVTEFAYLKMIDGLDTKTVKWKFVESISPPKTVQVLAAPMLTHDNFYGQVTVRFHTKQILAIYDRFGRLMMGSPYEPRNILEYVTFERHLMNQYGKWRIHGKKLVEEDHEEHEKTVAIIRKKPARAAADDWHEKEHEEYAGHKWYPARERLKAMANRNIVFHRSKRYHRRIHKIWELTVRRTPIKRIKRLHLRMVAKKSKAVYEMRQRGELPKP